MDSYCTDDLLPRPLWWAVWGGVAGVIAVIGLGALLIAAGATDPPVAGPVRWSDRVIAWAGGPVLTVAAREGAWYVAPETVPHAPGDFTLAVAGLWAADTDPLAAWGVWLEEPDGARVVYAVSASGYTTTRRCFPGGQPGYAIEDCPALRPEWRWSPHPRIRPPGEANTITLHREPDGAIRLRVNRERLGAAPVAIMGRWGVWVRGGDAPLALSWDHAEIRAPAD